MPNYNIGLTGLNANSGAMGVISNNIANSSTAGYRRTEYVFGTQFYKSLNLVSSDRGEGLGVAHQAMRNSLNMGSIQDSQNSLDMAITGSLGMFRLVDGQDPSSVFYSRNGQFALSREATPLTNRSYIVNQNGLYLTGYTSDNGKDLSDDWTGKIAMPPAELEAVTTQNAVVAVNLDSRTNAFLPAGQVPFNPDVASSYNNRITQTVYSRDDNGRPHELSLYYRRIEDRDLTLTYDGSSFTYPVSPIAQDVLSPEPEMVVLTGETSQSRTLVSSPDRQTTVVGAPDGSVSMSNRMTVRTAEGVRPMARLMLAGLDSQATVLSVATGADGQSELILDRPVGFRHGQSVDLFNATATVPSASSSPAGLSTVLITPDVSIEAGQFVFQAVKDAAGQTTSVTRVLDVNGKAVRVSSVAGQRLTLSSSPSPTLADAELLFYAPVAYRIDLQDGSELSFSGDLFSGVAGQTFTAVNSTYEVYGALDGEFYNNLNNNFYSTPGESSLLASAGTPQISESLRTTGLVDHSSLSAGQSSTPVDANSPALSFVEFDSTNGLAGNYSLSQSYDTLTMTRVAPDGSVSSQSVVLGRRVNGESRVPPQLEGEIYPLVFEDFGISLRYRVDSLGNRATGADFAAAIASIGASTSVAPAGTWYPTAGADWASGIERVFVEVEVTGANAPKARLTETTGLSAPSFAGYPPASDWTSGAASRFGFFGDPAQVNAALASLQVDQPNAQISVTITPQFPNGNFARTSINSSGSGVSSFDGWDVLTQRINLGTDQILGWPTPADPTRPAGARSTDAQEGFTGTVAPSFSFPANGTGSAIKLSTGGLQAAQGYAVFHGPALASRSTVSLQPGDEVSFDWKAEAGGDAHDVFAYLLNVNDGTTIPLFDDTGASAGAATPWRSETVTVNQAGEFAFVFVAGSYDASGGKALGGSLSVDNISVRSATPDPNDIRTIQNVAGPSFSVSQVEDIVRVRTESAAQVLGTHQPIAVMQFWGGRNIDALVSNPVSGSPTFESKVTLSGKVKTQGDTAQSTDPNLVFELDLTGTQNFASPFAVQEAQQDGRSVGILNNVQVADDGKIVGVYGDGRTYLAGQLVLVGFENSDGLVPAGGNAFKATAMSGGEVHASVIVGKPGSKSLGGILAGAIETSNVDMGNELVDLLVQQRLYTANAQSFRAFDETLNTTMGLMGG